MKQQIQPSQSQVLRRRGAAYVLVLATGVLLSVIGMGMLAASRGVTRTAQDSGDLAEAGTLAETGVHWGIAAIKADSGWRTTYTNNVETTPRTFGRGTMTFKLVDGVDGDLSNNSSDAVRLYAVGRCGSATRALSLELTGTGQSLDSLKSAAHSGGNVNVSSSITPVGGPISANGTLTVGSTATVTGDVEASAFAINGTVTGTRTTLTTSKSMPSAGVFNSYRNLATEIPFASIPSGTITAKLISSTSNPWGSPNAGGVYYIRVPSTGTLTVKSSRLVATLVVELESGGRMMTSSAFAWDPPRADYPALILKGTSSCTVTLNGSISTLNESSTGVNFNPAGTPDGTGASDTDMTDSYPAEFHGLLHVIGTGFTTTLGSAFNLKGAAVVEGPLSIGSSVKLTAAPALSSSPPFGYTTTTTMLATPSGWRWEQQTSP